MTYKTITEEVKEKGLEETLKTHAQQNFEIQKLISSLFSVAFDTLSDEDYEALIEQVLDDYNDFFKD